MATSDLIAIAIIFGVKLIGYLLIVKLFNTAFDTPNAPVMRPALVRTVMGPICGFIYCWLWGHLGGHALAMLVFFLLGLFFLRTVEWFVVIRLFWESSARAPARAVACAVLGAVWSHVLDLPILLVNPGDGASRGLFF